MAPNRLHAKLWPVSCGLLFLLSILTGCGGIQPIPEIEMSAEAGRLFSRLTLMNAEVTSIKGIGKLYLRSGPAPGSFRFAWAAVPPDRVRIEIMDPTGRPAGTLARDGTWTYLRNLQDGRLFRRRFLDRQIRKWLGVPVETDDLIALVSGRVPLRKHDAVQVIGVAAREGPMLVLRLGQTIVERIQMTPDGHSVTRVEIFSTSGTPAFHIDFAEGMGTDAGRLPSWLEIVSSRGESIRIEFLRYRKNIPLDPGMFTLDAARRATTGGDASPRYSASHVTVSIAPFYRTPLSGTGYESNTFLGQVQRILPVPLRR